MAEVSSKPGTACLCCRRRKLKCSREPGGCSSCVKASLPCIYPKIDPNVKRKRGPYKKKDKPAREAHLDHVVKYLSDPVTARETHLPGAQTQEINGDPASEDLVKDALVALTRTSVSDPNPYETTQQLETLTSYHLLLAWNLFTTRVDPMTKLIMCRDEAPLFFKYSQGQPYKLGDSICYAAVSTCTVDECQAIFGSSKTALQKHFGTRIQQNVVQDHSSPTLRSMQALVIYLVCLCREELESETWALFSLAVRNAQILDLHKEPTTTNLLEAELRRRIWWTICSVESRCSEEGVSKDSTLIGSITVDLPLNVNDEDLPANMTELPKPRIAVTSVSFMIVRWHIMKLTAYLVTKLRQHKASPKTSEKTFRDGLRRELDHVTNLLTDQILSHCHPSRPLDLVMLTLSDIMLIKCRLLIDFPDRRTAPEALTSEQRYHQLKLAVRIIRQTYGIMSDPKVAGYIWFFRSYLQWHSLAIVISEIGTSSDISFIRSAWEALEPFVRIWKRIYQRKQHDPVWQHVDGLINRAQASAEAKLNEHGKRGSCTSCSSQSCAEGMFPFQPSATASDRIDEWPKMPHELLSTPYSSASDVNMVENPPEEAMLDPLLDMAGFESLTDLDALNAVFADPSWDYGFESTQDLLPQSYDFGR